MQHQISSLTERWVSEQWLLEAGVVPAPTADTLLMYAYAQKGVEKVDITIDVDEANDGKSARVEYRVKLGSIAHSKWTGIQKAKTIQNRIFQKVVLLALLKVGAPLHLEEAIMNLAQDYLPENYTVEVKIVN